VEIGPAVRPGIEKKGKDRTGQDSQKSHKVVLFRLFGEKPWGEAPTVPIETKICLAGNLADIIMCTKFQDDIFRGYNFTGGGRIFHFPTDFCKGLTTVLLRCL